MLSLRKSLLVLVSSVAASLSPIMLPETMMAKAQESASVQAANEMLSWNQQYSAAYIELVSVFSTESMQDIYQIDFNDIDAVTAAFSKFNAEREAILAKAANMFNALEAPERWNFQRSLFDRREKAIYEACLNAYNSIDALQENVRDGSDFLPMFQLIQQGQTDEAVTILFTKQINASRAVVESENEQIKGFMLAIPEDNPNHQFQEIMLLGNNMALIERDFTNETVFDDETKAMRLKYASLMEKAIEDIPRLLATGRRNMGNTDRQLTQALTQRGISSEDRAFIERVMLAMKTFGETFDIEEKLLNNYKTTISTLRSDMSNSEREARIDENDLLFYQLIDQRVQISADRLNKMNQ